MLLEYLCFSNLIDRLVLSVFGIIVSAYALQVEIRKEANPEYKAVCDFSERMSCSKALCSEYGKGFGFVSLLVGKNHFLNQRNCTLGILFYCLQIALAFMPNQILGSSLLFYSTIMAGIGSVYLAVILFFILKDLCIVCISTYMINGGLLYLNYCLYSYKHHN